MATKVKPNDAEWRKWKRELGNADKREKEWRKAGEALFKQYRGAEKKKASFNMLYANTATLRPALYSSIPQPDVRRRFRDADPLGKAVAEVLERGLIYSLDSYDFNICVKADVLDALVPGRGISRIRYVPSLKQVPGAPAGEDGEQGEADEGDTEELDYEQVVCEHVDYRDFRRGYGRTWKEVEWIAFRHDLRKDDAAEKFGKDVVDEIEFEAVREDDDKDAKTDSDIYSDDSKTAEFWEFWDKEGEKVFFYTKSCQRLLYPLDNPTGDPPLTLRNFYPIPTPLQLIEDSNSLIPVAPYTLYKEQADELNNISKRINVVTNGLKLRGIYDSTLTELSQMLEGDDNTLTPVTNAQQYIDKGLDKAIMWIPIDMAAAVLKELYIAREMAKETVYEVSGISDIIRGATNANETATAQNLKAKYSSGRLSAMQRAVAEYCKELVCLMAEIMAEKFQPETMAKMSGLTFPTAQQKMQAQQQIQMQQQMAQQGQPAQPMPPGIQQMMQMPTWEDIMATMHDEMLRTFRVDVETDSTLKDAQQQDMSELREVLTGIVEFIQGIGPAVQAKAFPVEAVKAICLAIARRSRLGLEVEDALDKIQDPAPQGAQVDPKQIEQQVRQQVEQENLQKMVPKELQIMQREQDLAQREMALQAAEERLKAQQQVGTVKADVEHERAMMEVQKIVDDAIAAIKEELLRAETKAQVAQQSVDRVEKVEGDSKQERETLKGEIANVASALVDSRAEMMKVITEAMNKPRKRTIIRGKDGRAESLVEVPE
jgi:hypothetical protein